MNRSSPIHLPYADSLTTFLQAEHTSTVKALYDYESAGPGELTVTEDEILLVFETEQDWLLVQSQKEGGKAGYVPGNYVETYTEGSDSTVSPIVVPPSVSSTSLI